ncbi:MULTISPECIES: sensor histidine kinase [Acinetobacter]|uniref:sensor histidine kinase n=1 Tax=Acinetobacter TaxID=469 RepID=UPI00158DA5B0|nr:MULTISPECIES: histidine kinase [Acinetobacter]MCU4365589.1 histidine kinase [Acinetobacter variabilis]MCU4375448.1 histidine kinase [Acinetobacter variabilis]QKW81827.1 histidine kinase [Acinetobacter sp. FDAARGOS_724]
MWSCRLNQIKSSRTKKSITNSKPVAEVQVDQSFTSPTGSAQSSYFFSQIGKLHYLLEMFIGGNVLAMVLALAKAQSWQALNLADLLQYMLYINWILLCFAALVELFHQHFQRMGIKLALICGFLLLQAIVLVTTTSLNVLTYFGSNLNFQGLSLAIALEQVGLHLSFGILLGMFCFRYLYLREQWAQQQHSELNARIQAMQARIHPHFLFNSLNSVISLISIDPDKAEQMLLNLSRLFRASFQELKLVKLQEEIELCQRYLEIEQIRLGERLQVEWKLENKDLYSQVQIPLLTLQPLVENSIFHGVEKILTKSTISILIEILQNQINIIITNPYTQDNKTLKKGHGIAIENVRQRLEAYYGPTMTFQTFAGGGVFTTVVQYRYK